MRILAVSAFIVLADQITKLMVKGVNIPFLGVSLTGLQPGSSRPLWGDILRLTYVENPGMAFGIDIGGKMFFSIFSIVASIGILVYLYRVRNEGFAFRFSLAMILGGAVGNLIDRVFYEAWFHGGALFYGKVVDFIDADFFNINLFGFHLNRWPVFNIADASVTCGVLLLLVAHRRTPRDEALIAQHSSISLAGKAPETSVVPADSTRSSSAGESAQS